MIPVAIAILFLPIFSFVMALIFTWVQMGRGKKLSRGWKLHISLCPKCHHPESRHVEMPNAGMNDEGVMFCLEEGCGCCRDLEWPMSPEAA